MATEQYANQAQSTLSATIVAGDATLSVASAAAFPTVGNFQIVVDSEIMTVTAVSGTTFTITRGVEGTTAAGHSSGATVTQVLTRAGLLNVGQSLLLSDSYAALPSSSIVRLFLPTDAPTLWRDNGASWSPWGPINEFTPPVDANYSWVNQVSATVTAAKGYIHLHVPGTVGTGNSAHLRTTAAPATPYKITVYMVGAPLNKASLRYGVGFRESASGKLVTLDFAENTASPPLAPFAMRVVTWNNPTSPVAALALQGVGMPFNWLRFGDDGTNRTYEYSQDGQNWSTLFSEARTTFLTADQVFFWVQAENAATPNLDMSVTLYHWKQS